MRPGFLELEVVLKIVNTLDGLHATQIFLLAVRHVIAGIQQKNHPTLALRELIGGAIQIEDIRVPLAALHGLLAQGRAVVPPPKGDSARKSCGA